MYLERKRLISIVSLFIGLVCLALMGTPCYNYAGTIGARGYYTIYEFSAIYNDGLMAMGICLLSFVLLIVCFNIAALFVKKITLMIHGLASAGGWLCTIAFAIACMCAKRFNIAIVPTNALTFILLAAILGFGLTLFVLFKPEPEK